MCIKPPSPRHMLKDVMQLDKLGLEKVFENPIGLTSLNFGAFPRWDLIQVM
jgi:hypothetical protein